MSVASALVRVWNDSAAAFASSGYALFNIEAHIMCIVILGVLFVRQQNTSMQTEAGIIWVRLLFVQILYCMSWIFMVLADVSVIPSVIIVQYAVAAVNFGLFACVCWLLFLYMGYEQKLGFMHSLGVKIIAAVPFAFNLIMLVLSPLTGAFIDISGDTMRLGILWPLMLCINLGYPAASVVIAVLHRSKMTRYERDFSPLIIIYPALLIIFGVLQALNWKMPFLCYALVISDVFVYMSFAESLVSVDPITKIPNRNGFMRNLSERFEKGNLETLHVFAVDIDNMTGINSAHGRIEGDRALILTAEALKKFREQEHQCYAARYYGDEFIIAADIQDEEERELFIEHIRNYVSNIATHNRLPYHLRVSVGWAKYERFSATESISGLIEEAERGLIENRERRTFSGMWQAV